MQPLESWGMGKRRKQQAQLATMTKLFDPVLSPEVAIVRLRHPALCVRVALRRVLRHRSTMVASLLSC